MYITMQYQSLRLGKDLKQASFLKQNKQYLACVNSISLKIYTPNQLQNYFEILPSSENVEKLSIKLDWMYPLPDILEIKNWLEILPKKRIKEVCMDTIDRSTE
jgi:hypothetical protein